MVEQESRSTVTRPPPPPLLSLSLSLSQEKKNKQFCEFIFIFIESLTEKKSKKSTTVYGGAKATTLYIQIYQLLLRKQLHALIHTHGFPAQLETVVYDLWALRLQLLTKRLAGGADHETTDGEESRVFSSQAESLGEEIGSGSGVGGKGKEVGAGRDMPTLIETLGICYLGAVLLRIPVSVGSLVR